MTNPPCWLIPENVVAAERDAAAGERAAARATAPMGVTSGPGYYPPASRVQWFGNTYPGVDMGGVEKVLLHTTETGGWPGYSGGASAPTLTYDPRKHEWRQHFLLYRSARALRDPSYTLVRENRDRVVQVEIVACSDHRFADRYGYLDIRDLDTRAVGDLGAFIRFCHNEYGVPLTATPRWLDYPASYGNTAVRMSGPEFAAFRGVLGHQHASGNDHGDPDSIPIDRIMAAAAGDEDDMPSPKDWTAADWAAFDKNFLEALATSAPYDSPAVKAWAEANNYAPAVSARQLNEYAWKDTTEIKEALDALTAKVDALTPPADPA